MNYGKIIYCDTANGIGCRTVLFVSGCTHHCKGCFNDMAWPFNYGKEYTKETENKILESLKPDYIRGLSILGGKPGGGLEPDKKSQKRITKKRYLGVFRVSVGRADRKGKSEMQTWNG